MKKAGGIERLTNATRFSWAGLRAAFRNEQAFRQEVYLGVVMIPAAFWLGGDTLEKLLLIVSVLGVILVELLNSAIEAVVDRIGTQPHELAGRAKDLGSAAVLIALIIAATVWVVIVGRNADRLIA